MFKILKKLSDKIDDFFLNKLPRIQGPVDCSVYKDDEEMAEIKDQVIDIKRRASSFMFKWLLLFYFAGLVYMIISIINFNLNK